MYAHTSLSGLGTLGNVGGDIARFEKHVREARDAIAAMPEYVTKLRNAALKERVGTLFGSSNADALDNFARTLDNVIPTYKAILDKAVAEGSFARLADLQRMMREAMAHASKEAGGLLTPTMKLFLETVIVGTIVQIPAAAKEAIQATTDAVLKPVASSLSEPLKWIAIAALAVGVPYALYNIRKLA
jgi:hypothetical protein